MNQVRHRDPNHREDRFNVAVVGATGAVGEVLFRILEQRQFPIGELRALAKHLPQFLTLQEDGLLKVVAGTTTLSELADNSPRDDSARDLATLRMIAMNRSPA